MELQTKFKLLQTKEHLEKPANSVVMMALNCNLSFADAKLKNEYLSWKKF